LTTGRDRRRDPACRGHRATNGKRSAPSRQNSDSLIARPLHRKHYFPNEPGWFEKEWYTGDDSGFGVAEVLGIKVGVLLCIEAMFNEHARAYGRRGVSLIVIPRASGVSLDSWKIAGAMASLVSGAYVVSSNRVGIGHGGTQFGGGGYAYEPYGRLLAVTDSAHPMQILELDPEIAAHAQCEYPSYVSELG
jgi:N-carbamoylputrescine amidase